MLRLAGFSSGTGVCARGGTAGEMRNADTQQQTDSGCCVPAGMSCPRFTPAVCLAPNRTACGISRSCSAGSRSPFVRSRSVGAVICLLWVHFGFGRFFMAISTGYRDAGTELRGGQGWRRGLCAFCAATLALLCFPRGERWGCAPQTAPKSHWLSGLSSFDSRRGCALRGEGRSATARPPRQRALPASSAVSLAFALSMPPLFGSATGILPPSSMNAGSAAADL